MESRWSNVLYFGLWVVVIRLVLTHHEDIHVTTHGLFVLLRTLCTVFTREPAEGENHLTLGLCTVPAQCSPDSCGSVRLVSGVTRATAESAATLTSPLQLRLYILPLQSLIVLPHHHYLTSAIHVLPLSRHPPYSPSHPLTVSGDDKMHISLPELNMHYCPCRITDLLSLCRYLRLVYMITFPKHAVNNCCLCQDIDC